MKAAGRRNKAKGWPLGLALLISAAHAVVGDTGDFAPLAVGNTWVYTFQVQAGGFGWNPSGQHLGRRTLRVESRGEASGGDPVYVLSFRDSLYARWLGPVKRATGADYSLPDTVEAGRFQLVHSAVIVGPIAHFHPRGGEPPPAETEALLFGSGEGGSAGWPAYPDGWVKSRRGNLRCTWA